MSRSKGMNAASLFVGVLLCMVLMDTAIAAGNQNQITVNFENTGNISSSPITISPIINDNSIANGDAITDNTTKGDATTNNTVKENEVTHNTTTGNGTTDNTTTGNAANESVIIGNTAVNSVTPSYYSTFLYSGSGTQFTVSFTNRGNETLFLTPKVVSTPGSINKINESWITISPTNATVAPDSTQNFAVEVNVPWDTESGDYQATIAFTDDLVPNSTQYVNSMQFGLSVQAPSKIQLETSYISDTIDAGKEYEYTISMKNVAKKDVTIDPKLLGFSNYYDPSYASPLDPGTVEISAPSVIKAGEIANMTIKVNISENASGRQFGTISMNVDGETNNNYGNSPQVTLDFNVLKQPLAPYVKTFKTLTNDTLTIEVSADTADNYWLRSPEKEKPSFELGLTCNSEPANLTLVKSTESSSAAIGGYYPIWAIKDGNIYQSYGTHYVKTYTAPGEIGDWKLTLLPKDTVSFGYSITVGNSK